MNWGDIEGSGHNLIEVNIRIFVEWQRKTGKRMSR
jgi:hypothetical protein